MLQISGFVSGLVVVAYLHSYQFCLTFYILCLGCLPKMKEKNICNCITAADKIFVYHRQTQERINMLWNAGQFSLLFWKIYRVDS